MRQGAEYEGAAVELGVIVRDESHLLSTQAGARSLSLVGRGETEVKRGMSGDEGAELAAGVAGRAEHPDRNFMHGE